MTQVLARLATGRGVPALLTVGVGTAEPQEVRPSSLFGKVAGDGSVTPEFALAASAALVDDIPGVTPARLDPDAIQPDITTVLRWVDQVRDRLTPEQVAAIDAFLDAGEHVDVTEALAHPSRYASVVGRGDLQVAQAPGLHDGAIETLVRVRDAYRAKGVFAGMASIFGPDGPVPTLTLRPENSPRKAGGINPAYTRLWVRGDKVTGCSIALYADADQQPLGSLATILAHEYWHCLQGIWWGRSWGQAPAWVSEGQAKWAETNVLDEPDPQTAINRRRDYLMSPATSLFRRSYDAIGFYSEIDHLGRSPWSFMLSMYDLPPMALYSLAIASTDYVRSAGSAYFRQPTWGTAWDSGGRALPASSVAPARRVFHVAPGSVQQQSVLPFTDRPMEVTLAAPVTLVTVRGHGRLTDPGAPTPLDLPELRYAILCAPDEAARSGCACPTDEFRDVQPIEASPTVYLGAVGHLAGTRVSVQGYTLESTADRSSTIRSASHPC